MSSNAWYLRCGPEDVGPSAVLVGDRGRVLLAAELLDGAVILNEDRGLTTTTGYYAGERITVSAFGMGAPIATIVMHELAGLGVRRFVRLGTVMTIGETQLGELVVAHGAIRNESTSSSYLPIGYPAVPDFALTGELERAISAAGLPTRSGLYATFDGFYTEMFETGFGSEPVAQRYGELAKAGVVAADMETSALLVAARALGVTAASLCLASVSGITNEKMAHDERLAGEAQLLRVGFDALASSAVTAQASDK